MKSIFPKQEWTDFALNEVIESGLQNEVPADALDFRIDGTAQSWVHLLAAMAKHESDFKPALTYQEGASLGGVISTGLFQMSQQSVRGYSKFARNGAIKTQIATATTEKLKDPFYNMMVAVIILKRWVQGDGVIATGTSPWLGGSRYWAVLRKGAPKVRKTLDDFAASVPSPAPESLFKPISAEIGTVTSSAIGGNTLSVSAASPAEVALAFEAREGLGSKCNWIFEVDFSINSKFPRLFVYSIRDKTLYKYKCAHGGGGKNGSPHDGRIREVSNVPNSGCSSLGVIRTGENYDSDVVGEAVRLHGLSPTNSKMLSRGVVLHGGQYVFDDEANSDKSISGRSRGCLVVNDRYIDRESGGELIEWLKDGSIGVAHYAGEFKLPV